MRSGLGEFHECIASTGVRAGEWERRETRFKNPESRGRNLNREWTQIDANQFLGIDRLIFSGVLSSSVFICVHLLFNFLIGLN